MGNTLRLRLPGLRGAALVLLLGTAGSGFAQQWTFSEFRGLFENWDIDSNSKTISISDYKSESTVENLVIPETIVWEDGEVYTVTDVKVFYKADNLKSVTFPATIKAIGSTGIVFYNCANLERLQFNGDLDYVGPLFSEIESLKEIVFKGNIDTIGDNAFNSPSLEAIDIAGYVKNVEAGAFGDSGIKEIEFKEGLEAVTLPLRGDNTLVSVTFPQSLKEIKYRDDDDCSYMYYTRYQDSYGIDKLTFNVADLEAWCVTPIAGYDPKKYVYHDNYDENGNWMFATWEWEGEFIPVTINYRGKEITSLNVPMGVETIKPYAFAGVEGLTSVALPDDIKEIGDGAFAGASLSAIEIPESVAAVGAYAFAVNKDLQDIVLPSGLTSLGDYAFFGDIALYEMEIPAGVKRIGAHAFDGCVDMETITLNEGLEEIGDYAFYYNSRIKEIKFPESLKAIGERAFAICGMQELEFGDNLRHIGPWAFARYDSKLQGEYPETPNWWDENNHNDDPTSKIKFGSTLESIGERAFAAWNVRTLSLPETVTEIGKYAFQYSKISEITIPAEMKNLGNGAFAQCRNLAVVNFPEGLETIGELAFYQTSMRELNLPASLKEIGKEAFCEAPILNAVVPDAVTAIGEKAFSTVNYLTIGSGVAAISKPIAESCDMLKMTRPTPPTLGTDRLGFEPKVVIVPAECGDKYRKNNRWKDYNIFGEGENKAVVNVNKEANEQLADQLVLQSRLMPAQVASLAVYGELDADDWAVIRSNMTSLYDLDLTNIKNTEIPSEALAGKSTLLNLTLPASLTVIGYNAFKGCALMHMPSLPSTLIEIGDNAFDECKSLDSDWIMPASLARVGKNAFRHCESLKGLDFSDTEIAKFDEGVDVDNTLMYWDTSNVFAYTYSLSKLVLPSKLERIPTNALYASGIRTLEIPESVKVIGSFAFQDSSIERVEIPEGVETISFDVFKNSNIEGITLPSTLKSLGGGSFSGTPLVYANLNDGLEEVEAEMFAGCQDLMVVNLPSSLKSIGENAIAAPALTAINAPVVDPAVTSGNPFEGVDNMTCALSIPRQSFTKYLRAEYWGSFVGVRNNIDVTIPEEVEVTYIDEDDYQEMLEDMQEEQQEPQTVRRRAMRVMRANNIVSEFKGYGKIFNGAALYRDGKGKTRFFINVNPSELKDVTVTYNNVDITSQIDPETMSFVTEPLKMNATLNITYKGQSGIEEISSADVMQTPVDVYDLTGRLVLCGATDFSNLPAGIYIAGGKKVMVK